MANERWTWDATANLEALGAAEVALWVWEPQKDRLRLTGATRSLGLGPLAPDCSSAALRALTLPQDRAMAEDILRLQQPGGEVAVRLRLRGGAPSVWRGVWLEDGVRAAGVVAAEVRFAASGIDPSKKVTASCGTNSSSVFGIQTKTFTPTIIVPPAEVPEGRMIVATGAALVAGAVVLGRRRRVA